MSTPTPVQPGEPAWLHSHVHEPNPAPPVADPSLTLIGPSGALTTITVGDLARLPQQSIPDCYIVSTGHGASGPFCFEGVTLGELFTAYGVATWGYADITSADHFGARILYQEVDPTAKRPILLAIACDGKPLTRAQGLVRLIVPQETDDALRQVKWVAAIEVH